MSGPVQIARRESARQPCLRWRPGEGEESLAGIAPAPEEAGLVNLGDRNPAGPHLGGHLFHAYG